MSSVATPNGATPVGTLSASGSFSGKVRHIPIATTYDTAIFTGDFVHLVTGGFVEVSTMTTAFQTGLVGIFMGCAYTDPTTGQLTFSANWPANNAATDAGAYVADDPNLIFQMQADDAIPVAGLGFNVSVVQTAGSTTIGRSKNALDGSSEATTATLPLRIIGFVDGPDSAAGDAYTDCYVTYTPGQHAYTVALGI